MSDIEDVCQKVTDEIWVSYEKEENGELIKDEIEESIIDSLGEITDGDTDEHNSKLCLEEWKKGDSKTISKKDLKKYFEKV